MILCKLGEYEEFAEALFGQLSVEIDEEKEITQLAIKAKEGLADKVRFKELEDITKEASIPSHHWVNNLDFIKPYMKNIQRKNHQYLQNIHLNFI